MAVLDDVRTLLNISDISKEKDDFLNLYIRKADTTIKKYLNLADDDTTDILIEYPDAVCQYVVESYNRQGNEGYSQFMQGSRQGMLKSGLSDEVKYMLPAPYVKMMG